MGQELENLFSGGNGQCLIHYDFGSSLQVADHHKCHNLHVVHVVEMYPIQNSYNVMISM